MVAGRNYEQVTAEFARGKAVCYPNGVWSYTQIKDDAVKDDDLMMLPYYMGIEGEEHYGPAGIYDASWAVNRNASTKDKEATLAFISWLVTDDQARTILSKDMGFAVPFTTFDDDYQPDNPSLREPAPTPPTACPKCAASRCPTRNGRMTSPTP